MLTELHDQRQPHRLDTDLVPFRELRNEGWGEVSQGAKAAMSMLRSQARPIHAAPCDAKLSSRKTKMKTC